MTGENIFVAILLWPFRQVAGWLDNFYSVLTTYQPTDFIPPALADTLSWLRDQIPQAFGFGTPGEQMSSSVILALASVFTSVFTGGVTLFFVGVFMLTFVGGALRLWPVVDMLWPLGEAET